MIRNGVPCTPIFFFPINKRDKNMGLVGISLVVMADAFLALGFPYIPTFITGNPFWGMLTVMIAGASIYSIWRLAK